MGDPAREITNDPLAIEGLEDVFDQDSPKDGPGIVLDQTQNSPGSVQESPGNLVHPISVDEAARLLNVSTNAVCKRLRKGTLIGRKIPGKFKDEWLVEGAGLIEVLKVDFNAVQDSPKANFIEFGSVLDQTEDSPGSVQESPDSLGRLVDLIEKQATKLEAAAGQIGYLQAQMESQTNLLNAKEAEIKLLMDSQQSSGWWRRFCLWFLGTNSTGLNK